MRKKVAIYVLCAFIAILFFAYYRAENIPIHLDEITSRISATNSCYIGKLSSMDTQNVASDVFCCDIEIYNDNIYIAYAEYNSGIPKIYVRKFYLDSLTLSNPVHIADYDTIDHFSISSVVDDDGYMHLVWGKYTNKETYVRTRNSEDINHWVEKELFCDDDATYSNARAYGDTFYNLYRDGTHGQGWKLIWKRRNESDWKQVKIVSGTSYSQKHLYLNNETQWLFEDPRHQYFTPYWTYDNALGGEGEHRYQRVTLYNLDTRKHYHLNGELIEYKDGSQLPHEGPLDFYKQCGDYISDSYQPKYPRNDMRHNQLGRIHLGIQRTGYNLVVLSNYGEDLLYGYPPRGLIASVWDGTSWKSNVLECHLNEDLGGKYIQNVRGYNGETLWLVHRKPSEKPYTDSATDITILRNTNNGFDWTYEHITDDDLKWYGFPEAVYSKKYNGYLIAWMENIGNRSCSSDLKIAFKKLDQLFRKSGD